MNLLRSKLARSCVYKYFTLHSESYLSGTSAGYIEQLYNQWLNDRNQVPESWDIYFNNVGVNTRNTTHTQQDLGKYYALQLLIRSYQVRGHLVANLDPLKIRFGNLSNYYDRQGKPDTNVVDQVVLDVLGDQDAVYDLPLKCHIGGNDKSLPLKQIIQRLENTYCSTVGVEFMHIDNTQECEWIRKKVETPNVNKLSADVRVRTINRLIRTSGFEAFLAKKWSSEKHFGLGGCEVFIPAMKQIIDTSTLLGVDSFVVGMPHRGRLNVLANVFRKPLNQIFTQFAGLEAADEGSGDVKYHLGTYIERINRATNKTVQMSIVANPSHLEAVDPVTQGKARAQQFYRNDKHGRTVMTILLHGDAAFSGQGVVYETFTLSHLPEYTTHGTVHIVVNNQIGFTTDPRLSRSSNYCTDVARVVNAPIFHVNADDPDAVIHVSNIAAEYRATFHKDVVIDIVGYRRSGHNEIDEPMFTQPLMYTKIKDKEPVLKLYEQLLVKDNVIEQDYVVNKQATYDQICEEHFQTAKQQTKIKYKDWIDSPWSEFFNNTNQCSSETGITEDVIQHIATVFASPPKQNFVLHKGIDRILKTRMDLISSRTADWAIGEALAIGSLLKEGIHVRLSGQDVERGTFSHRHHVLHHQTKDKTTYNMLNNLYPGQAMYSVCNSSLSEYGVLGFELGYSMVNPMALVMWEAQFGDFNNTAQTIIDQFISSGQSKWVRQSGLVMLQPHGMEGMGPEHSSGRLERFLQLSDDDEDEILQTAEENFETEQL